MDNNKKIWSKKIANNLPAAIIVTGTPGTGKTTVSKKISEIFDYHYLDGKQIIKKNKLSLGYDEKRKCEIIDEKQFCKSVKTIIKENNRNKKHKGIVIDSHLAQYINPRCVDLCIVTKCNLKLLKNRLKRRGYAPDKIKENLECEIFDVCFTDSTEIDHKICVIETDKIRSKKDIKRIIEKRLKEKI